jgi:F420-non-reducing hydrogenase iron-sulfur subunit
MTTKSEGGNGAAGPRILVFSTAISDPGIDFAGSLHLHYSPQVSVIAMPCTSGIKPAWILHALERGFDGVFIAADGEECSFLPDCAQRGAKIAADAQALLEQHGFEPQRLKMAAICSVCGEHFVRYVRDFSGALAELNAAKEAR